MKETEELKKKFLKSEITVEEACDSLLELGYSEGNALAEVARWGLEKWEDKYVGRR